MKPYYQDDAVTIYHGDCREIVPTLGRFDLLLTDPPYGINNHEFRGSLPNSMGRVNCDSIQGDESIDLAGWVMAAHELADFAVVWGANNFPELLPHKGRWLCWDKRLSEQADKMLGSAFELAWTSKKSGFGKMFRCLHGGVVNANGGKRLHPTEKPIALMKWCITLAGDVHTILDPFAGSCTTGRAAKDLGRKCVCIEREERYCEIGAKRCQQEVFDFKDSPQNPLDTPPPHLASVGYPEKSNGAGDPDFDLAPPFGPHIPHPVTAAEAEA